MSGTIVGLFIAPGKGVPLQARQSATAITGVGLEGDWHARPESKRQVLLMDEETLIELGVPPGRVRENITTRGIDLKSLERGTHLRVGNAIFEITLPCTPCEFIDEIRPGLREKMIGQRGMLARVVQGGEIKIGDVVDVKQ